MFRDNLMKQIVGPAGVAFQAETEWSIDGIMSRLTIWRGGQQTKRTRLEAKAALTPPGARQSQP